MKIVNKASQIQFKPLGEVLTFKRGYDLPESKRTQGMYPVISSAGVTGYHNEFKAEGEGIVTGRYGTIGEMYYFEGKYWPLNTALYVKDFKGNLPKYTYYLLKNMTSFNGKDKSAVPGVNRNVLHDIPVTFHEDILVQKHIAKALSVIDDKIQINKQINFELESMAKTIYDYWFTQFDFPNEEGKPYKSSGGEMVWNEELKREIPKGWSSERVSRVCKISSGYPFQSLSYTRKGKYKLITIKNVQDNGISTKVESYINLLPDNLPNYCKLKNGDILMSLTGNVGRVGLMFSKDCLLNQRVAIIIPNDIVTDGFVYFLFKSEYMRLKMESIATGTSQKNLSPVDTENLYIPFNIEVILNYSTIVNHVTRKIVANYNENEKLIDLRDWLLPMLMNGQVSVQDAENVVAGVFDNKQDTTYKVKQAARTMRNSDVADDTADLVKEFLEHKRNEKRAKN